MTKEEARELAEVLEAFANGEQIQCMGKDWVDTDRVELYPAFNYRVKPPWAELKKGDVCKVKNFPNDSWRIRVFAGTGKTGKARTFSTIDGATFYTDWNYCEPFKLEEVQNN